MGRAARGLRIRLIKCMPAFDSLERFVVRLEHVSLDVLLVPKINDPIDSELSVGACRRGQHCSISICEKKETSRSRACRKVPFSKAIFLRIAEAVLGTTARRMNAWMTHDT